MICLCLNLYVYLSRSNTQHSVTISMQYSSTQVAMRFSIRLLEATSVLILTEDNSIGVGYTVLDRSLSIWSVTCSNG